MNRNKLTPPKSVSLNRENFLSTFGKSQYEEAAIKLIKTLSLPSILSELPKTVCDNVGEGWSKLCCMEETGISPVLFATMCAGGWIRAGFHLGTFYVSDEFLQRLIDKGIIKEKETFCGPNHCTFSPPEIKESRQQCSPNFCTHNNQSYQFPVTLTEFTGDFNYITIYSTTYSTNYRDYKTHKTSY